MAKRKPKRHRRELAVFRAGTRDITSLSWSPDGTRLALGGRPPTLEVCTRDGALVWRSEGHTDRVRTVAWSPDGTRIASVSFDCTVRVWDALTGRELYQHDETGMAESRLYGLAWSPDGRKLTWARWDNPAAIRVYDGATGRQVHGRLFPDDQVLSFLAWSPDGRWLGVVFARSSIAVLEGDTLQAVWEVPVTLPEEISWSPDSRRLACVTDEAPARLLVWDAVTEREIGRVERAHRREANAINWSRDGKVLATGGKDATIGLWSADGLTELDRLTGHDGQVWALGFAPTGGVLASGGEDGTLRLWDVSDLVPEHPKEDRTDRVAAYLSLQARTVGRRPSAAAPVERWVPTGLPGAGSVPYCLGYFPDAGAELDLFPDDRHLVAHTTDGHLVKWSLESGAALWRTQLPTGNSGLSVRVSPDGTRVAVATDCPAALVYDATGIELRRGPRHENNVRGVSWSPKGNLLASGDSGSDVQVWDAATGAVRHAPTGHSGGAYAMAWSPDGRLATGDGSVVRVWSSEPNRVSLTWQSQDIGTLWGVAWSPDGARLASSSTDKVVRVWDSAAGRIVMECQGHTGIAYRLDWSPDGLLLASTSGSPDRSVRVWDTTTGAELARFEHPNITSETFELSWASSGAFLVAGSASGAFVWDTRHLLSPAPPPTTHPTVATPLPVALSGLPSALAVAHRLSLHPPLSALRDALALAAGHSPPPDSALSALGEHPTVVKLRALNWPEPARRGLAAYLLRDVSYPQTFAPPVELTLTELLRALERALSDATDVAPEPPPIPAGTVQDALDALSDRALNVLRAVGHRAVATDPGLVARVVASAGRVPSTPPKVDHGLGSRSGGSAVGSFGGAERAGVSSRGDWRSVAPSQWALPVDVFAAKARRGEILFRSARSARPDDRSPVVVVLDVSPATWGPVGAAARAAAVSVLEARWRGGAGGWVVASGGEEERVWEVRSPGDWAAVWSVRSNLPSDGERALRTAEQVRRCAGWARSSVLVLSHVWFGAGVPRVGRVAAVLVRPPGGRGSGPRSWADRWVEVAPEPQHTAKAAETLLAELSG